MSRGALQSEACPFCELVYGRWHPKILSYSEAYVLVFKESERRAEAGDYSYPASRRHVLAFMRAVKVAEWTEHVYRCGEAAELELGGLEELAARVPILVAGDPLAEVVPF